MSQSNCNTSHAIFCTTSYVLRFRAFKVDVELTYYILHSRKTVFTGMYCCSRYISVPTDPNIYFPAYFRVAKRLQHSPRFFSTPSYVSVPSKWMYYLHGTKVNITVQYVQIITGESESTVIGVNRLICIPPWCVPITFFFQPTILRFNAC
jgi:hypothetical protein